MAERPPRREEDLADQSVLEARRGRLPMSSAVRIVKRLDSVSDRALSIEALEKPVTKLKAQKGGPVMISVNPYFIGIGIKKSMGFTARLIEAGTKADSMTETQSSLEFVCPAAEDKTTSLERAVCSLTSGNAILLLVGGPSIKKDLRRVVDAVASSVFTGRSLPSPLASHHRAVCAKVDALVEF